MGLKYLRVYGCLQWVWVAGSEKFIIMRMYTISEGGVFGLTLSQTDSNSYIPWYSKRQFTVMRRKENFHNKATIIIIDIDSALLQYRCNFYVAMTNHLQLDIIKEDESYLQI